MTSEVCSLILQQNKDADLEGFTVQTLMTAELIIKPDPDERECLVMLSFMGHLTFFPKEIFDEHDIEFLPVPLINRPLNGLCYRENLLQVKRYCRT